MKRERLEYFVLETIDTVTSMGTGSDGGCHDRDKANELVAWLEWRISDEAWFPSLRVEFQSLEDSIRETARRAIALYRKQRTLRRSNEVGE